MLSWNVGELSMGELPGGGMSGDLFGGIFRGEEELRGNVWENCPGWVFIHTGLTVFMCSSYDLYYPG